MARLSGRAITASAVAPSQMPSCAFATTGMTMVAGWALAISAEVSSSFVIVGNPSGVFSEIQKGANTLTAAICAARSVRPAASHGT